MGGVCDGKGRSLIDWEESVIVRGGAFLIGVSLYGWVEPGLVVGVGMGGREESVRVGGVCQHRRGFITNS